MEIGYIIDLLPGKYTESKQDELTIQFDVNEIVYQRNEWYKDYDYAQVFTNRKEAIPVVILPITNQKPPRMLQRNLIYTAKSLRSKAN